ncbi:MAG: hypothetical protein ACR2MN_03880 [Acidimicrobiales bacterium]
MTPPDHPGAGRPLDTLAAVSDESFVCLPDGSGLHAPPASASPSRPAQQPKSPACRSPSTT